MAKIFLWICTLLLTSGCVTGEVFRMANYEQRTDIVKDVKKSYLGSNGNIYLCTFGTINRKESVFWVVSTQDVFAQPYGAGKVESIIGLSSKIRAGCDNYPSKIKSSIEIIKLDLPPYLKSNQDIITFLDKEGKTSVLYQVKKDKNDGEIELFYSGQYPKGGKNITLQVSSRLQYGHQRFSLWYLLLPPAVVVDIILTPVYLIGGTYVFYQLTSGAGGDLH